MCVFGRWEQQTNSVMQINNEKQGGGQEFWKKVIVDQCEKVSGSLIFRILDYY